MYALLYVAVAVVLAVLCRRGEGRRGSLAALGGRAARVMVTSAVVFAATSAVVRLAPGGPFDGEAKLDPAVRERLRIRAAEGKDGWFESFDGFLRGDLGPSTALRDFDVVEILVDGAARSFALGVRALLWAACIGIVAAAAASRSPGGATDRALTGLGMLCLGLPTFAWAALLIGVFAFGLGIAAPASTDGSPTSCAVAVAALGPAAMVAALVRNEMIRVRRAPFVAAAAARGVSAPRRFFLHVLPQSLLPAAAYLGPAAASLLTGSLAVESIFGVPGLGTHLVQAAAARDFPVVAGAATLYAAALGFFETLGDAAARALAPAGPEP